MTSMKHHLRLKVRFNEVDAAGIVFYPRFFDYFHMAFEGFFGAATGVDYPEWIRERRIGWPAVHIDTTYLAPLAYGTEVDVVLQFDQPGRSSFVCRYEAWSADGTTLFAKAAITVVTTDLDRMKSMPIPGKVREALVTYGAG
jgi:4-hydroxybenzoyl-CoA thioesterase